MSPLKHTLFYLSLVLNCLLVVAMIYRGVASPGTQREAGEPAGGKFSGSPADSANREAGLAASLKANYSDGRADAMGNSGNRTGSFQWKQIETCDLREYIANLRAIGVPTRTIAVIALAELQSGATELTQGEPGADAGSYWKQPENDFGVDSRAHVNIMDLLRGAEYGFLSSDKQQEIMMLDQDFQVLHLYVHQNARGYILPEDQEELQRLEMGKRAELESLLTQEELWEYDLRNSDISNRMRNELRFTDVTEEEFREIYAFRRALEEESGLLGPPTQMDTPEDRQQRAAARRRLEEQLMEVFGEEERYRRYELWRDPEHHQLVRLTNRLELPRERAFEIIELKEMVRNHERGIESDTALSPDEKNEALRQLVDVARQEGIAVLGEKGFEAHRQRGGWWIQNLEQYRSAPVAAE